MATRSSKRKREKSIDHSGYMNNIVEKTSNNLESKENKDNEKKYWLMKSEV